MIPYVNQKDIDEEGSNPIYEELKPPNISWRDRLLLSKPLKLIIIFLLTAVIAPLLIYQYHFLSSLDLPPTDGFSFGSCLISRENRIPCGYGDINRGECHTECCYDLSNGFCFHRFPSRFSYIMDGEWNKTTLLNPRIANVPYRSQASIRNLRISFKEITATHLTLTFYEKKFENDIDNSEQEETTETEISEEETTEQGTNEEVTTEAASIEEETIENKQYQYEVTGEELNVIVNASHGTIFNTARGPLIASENIWEITFTITNETMYGLGEIPLKEDTTKVIYNHKGGFSSIPLIFAKLNGSYHGLLIDTINPTEVLVRSNNQLIVRSITNTGLKFHLFVGPKPVDIMNDVRDLIGVNKKLEYWMLGVHICSEGISEDPLADLQTFITSANSLSMPFESHCGVGPIMFNVECDNTYTTLVNSGATALRNARKKFVPHVSPYIRYTEPEVSETEEVIDDNTDIYGTRFGQTTRCLDDEDYKQYMIQNPSSEHLYIGSADGHDVIYPNYKNISKEFIQHLWHYNEFDAVILDNNWPLDESKKGVNETDQYLPYFSENFERAFENTPQWNATLPERYLYNHNEYGNHFVSAFQTLKEDVIITSTSQWMDGHVVVNRQGVETSWSSLQRELIAASLGGISGHWYWSSPICGDTKNFNDTTQNRLCAKWYMAATYFPLIKIHSNEIRRDPLAFDGTDRTHMLLALRKRMILMPYLYSILQEGPLLRPMFYQYPNIHQLSNLVSQFAVGNDLIIVPNLHPDQSHIHFWLPPGQWFEMWSGLWIQGEVGEAVTMTTTEADFFTVVRGGSIIITHEDSRLTTADTQLLSALTISVALHCEITYVIEETTTDYNEITVDGETSQYPTTTTTEPTTAAPVKICSASGTFYATPNMKFLFKANEYMVNVTVDGYDFDIMCSWNDAIWTSNVWNLYVYGLEPHRNNYDHHMYEWTFINLCDLMYTDVVTHTYGQ